MCHGQRGKADVMVAGKSFRQIDDRSWDLARRLGDMDRSGVTRQVLSPMPELLSYWFGSLAGLEMSRYVNHTLAEMVAQFPTRFSGLGMVPLQDPPLAAEELARIKADGLCGVEVGSNVNGKYLGEPEFAEFLAEAAHQDLALFVHALHPAGAERLSEYLDLIPFSAFPVDTALCAMTLIRTGVPERHPSLRIGFSHGGGAIVPLAHRLGRGAQVTDHFSETLKKRPIEYARQFFYDNLVYDQGYMRYLAEEFAPGQFFCGTDYPYLIMEEDPASTIEATKFADPESIRWRAAHAFLGIDARI
jgi:aminocarboxymuconate-semialdehyde decarboxylase